MHRGGDSSGYSRQADLADSAGAELVDFLVRVVEEMYIDRWRVGVYRHDVVGEIAVDRCAGLRVVRGVLEQGHANAHHHRAFDLVATRERIEDAAGVDDGHDPADAQAGDLRLPCDLDKVT